MKFKTLFCFLLVLILLFSLPLSPFAAASQLASSISRSWDAWKLCSDSVIIPTFLHPPVNGEALCVPHEWNVLNAIERLEYLAKEDSSLSQSISGRTALLLELDWKSLPANPLSPKSNYQQQLQADFSTTITNLPDITGFMSAEAAKPIMALDLGGQVIVMLPAEYGVQGFGLRVQHSLDENGLWRYELSVTDGNGQAIKGLIMAFKWEKGPLYSPLASGGVAFGQVSVLEQALGLSIGNIERAVDNAGENEAATDFEGYLAYIANELDSGQTGYLLANADGGIVLREMAPAESGQAAAPMNLYVNKLDAALILSDYPAFVEQLKAYAGDAAWLLDRYSADTQGSGLSRLEDIHNLTALALCSRFDYADTKLSALSLKADGASGRFGVVPGTGILYDLAAKAFARLDYPSALKAMLRSHSAEPGYQPSPEEMLSAFASAAQAVRLGFVCRF